MDANRRTHSAGGTACFRRRRVGRSEFHVSPTPSFSRRALTPAKRMAMRIAMSHPARFAGRSRSAGRFRPGEPPFAIWWPPGDWDSLWPPAAAASISRRASLRGLAASSHRRPVDHVAAVSLRPRVDAADVGRRGSLDHRADHRSTARPGRIRRRVVARRRVTVVLLTLRVRLSRAPLPRTECEEYIPIGAQLRDCTPEPSAPGCSRTTSLI